MPQDLTYYFRRSWGGEGDYLGNPWGIAVAEDGLIYLTDLRLDRITEITPGINIYRSIGGFDFFDPEKFSSPEGIALAQDNTIYAVDSGMNQVKQFTRNGDLINYWGGRGQDPGEFEGARAVAVSVSGKVYVADSGNNRIQVFDEDGNFLSTWGSYGSGNGEFIYPRGVATDSSENVYVVDEHNHRVQKFSETGSILLSWGERGSGDLQFERTTGIATDINNLIYVMDAGNAKIKIFNSTGELQKVIPLENIHEYPEYHFSNLTVDLNGNIYYSQSQPNSLVKVSPNGVKLYEWNQGSRPEGKFDYLHGIGINNLGNLFVADRFNNRIQVFSPDGGFLYSIENVDKPIHLDFDTQDNLYVTCSGDGLVKKFNLNGDLVKTWGGVGSGDGLFNTPWAITVDDDGYVFVSDYYNENIQKFTSEGTFVDSWGSSGSGTGQFSTIEDIFFSNGILYVVDGNNSRVQLFNTVGSWIQTWDGNQLFHPYAISQAPNEEFFVAEYDNVQVYSTQGNYLYSLFQPGSGPSEVRSLKDILFSNEGNLYLSDSGNERIQMFTQTIPDPDYQSGLVQNGLFESPEDLKEWSYYGTIAQNSVSLSDVAFEGMFSVRLGVPVPQIEQGFSQAVATSTFFVDPGMIRPLLHFNYKMFVNDNLYYSDFLVEVQTGDGRSNKAVVLHDGYLPCTGNYAPRPGRDLGWRTGSFDLSAYKGQHVRIVFSNRNLWPDSLGIWTNVDNVRVLDAGPLPPAVGPYKLNLPLINLYKCDIPDYTLQGGLERPVLDR
jgi:DNA-binding beta-propeller fold protein YncE